MDFGEVEHDHIWLQSRNVGDLREHGGFWGEDKCVTRKENSRWRIGGQMYTTTTTCVLWRASGRSRWQTWAVNQSMGWVNTRRSRGIWGCPHGTQMKEQGWMEYSFLGLPGDTDRSIPFDAVTSAGTCHCISNYLIAHSDSYSCPSHGCCYFFVLASRIYSSDGDRGQSMKEGYVWSYERGLSSFASTVTDLLPRRRFILLWRDGPWVRVDLKISSRKWSDSRSAGCWNNDFWDIG